MAEAGRGDVGAGGLMKRDNQLAYTGEKVIEGQYLFILGLCGRNANHQPNVYSGKRPVLGIWIHTGPSLRYDIGQRTTQNRQCASIKCRRGA